MLNNKKHSYLLLLFLFSLVIFLWSIPRPAKVRLRFESDNLKLYYNQELVFHKSLALEPNKIKIELNHEQDFLLIPPLLNTQQVTIRSLKNENRETGQIKPIIKKQTVVKNLLLGPYYSGLMSDDSYDLASYFSSVNSYSDFEMEATILNPTVVRIHLSDSHFWLRPLWHQETIFFLSQDTPILGNPLTLDFTTLVKQILAKISLNLLSTIIIFYLLLGFLTLLGFVFPKSQKLKLSWPAFFKKNSFKFWFALIISGVFLLNTLTVANQIHRLSPTSQDEVAYLFQAKILSLGKLYVNSVPAEIRPFFDQEFMINNGKWFGKYTIGGSLGFALGYILGSEYLINPLISAASLVLLFFLCRSIYSTRVAVITTLLFVISPFNLLISASYFSHPTALFFTLLLCYSLFKKRPYLSGLALGMIFLTRPFSGFISTIFIIFFLLKDQRKDDQLADFKFLFRTALMTLPFLLFQLYHNYLLSGSVFRFPINIYNPYDTLGFGLRGVEWGSLFTPLHALENVTINFYSLTDMLFGWPFFLTLAFVPFAFLLSNKSVNKISLLFLLFFLMNVAGYFFYHSAGAFFGPRYWYEVSFCLFILTAIGIDNLILYLASSFNKLVVSGSVGLLVTILLLISITRTINYLPIFEGYGETKPVQVPPLSARSIVLIPSSHTWYEYGMYLLHQSPLLDNQIIFARFAGMSNLPRGKQFRDNKLLKKYFPDRKLFLLNPEDGKLEEL